MSEEMIFCLGEGKYESQGAGYQKNLQIFNTPITQNEYNTIKSSLCVKDFKLPLAKWIDKKDMSDEEKKNHTSYSETGGYLKVLSYENAWKELWEGLSKDNKNFFLTLPHFSAEIFEKITGIKINEEIEEMTLAEDTQIAEAEKRGDAWRRGYLQGVKEENEAWLNNKRCGICGAEIKDSTTNSLCDKCWEEA